MRAEGWTRRVLASMVYVACWDEKPLNGYSLEYTEDTELIGLWWLQLSLAGHLGDGMGLDLGDGRLQVRSMSAFFVTLIPGKGLGHEAWGWGHEAHWSALRIPTLLNVELGGRCAMRRVIKEMPLRAGCTSWDGHVVPWSGDLMKGLD